MLRWTEEQLREHEERMAKLTGQSVPFAPLRFTLEWLPPLANQWERLHWRARGRVRKRMAAEMIEFIPAAMSGLPLERARVHVVRESANVPDQDGLNGMLKPILDVLQVRSKRHPHGLGVLVDDDPTHLSYTVEHRKAPRKQGRVIIEVDRL